MGRAADNEFVEVPVYPKSISFAAGAVNSRGIGMKIFRNDKIVRSTIEVPEHLGRDGRHVHEGILVTMLDEVMAWAVLVFLRKNVFTKSLTTNFHKPVPVMEMIRIESWVRERTGEREAIISGAVYNSSGELCVSSEGSFSLMDKEYVEKLGLADQEEMDYCWDLFDTFEKYGK